MKEITIESCAKVNLGLDILYKRQDGYHEIKSVMQEIDLRDKLVFEEIDSGLLIESSHPTMPKDSDNLVYRAWKSLKELTGINKGIRVKIEKNIPIGGGLAGGSSNAAATLKALNQMWQLGFSQEELMDIGRDLGADIPFCIMGGTALAQGIGDKLTSLKAFSNKDILLCNPGIPISTPYVYSRIDTNGKRLDIEGLVEGIEENDLAYVGDRLANRMEATVIKEYPVIKEIKETMIKNGALGALMSGSGSTVFGLFQDRDKMEYSHRQLSKTMDKVYMTKTR